MRGLPWVAPPPPPVIETLSYRFRRSTDLISDGNFKNEDQHSEPYTSVFVASLEHPSPLQGNRLTDFAICLLHQGIVMLGPLLTCERPFIYLVALDTNFALPVEAAFEVLQFLNHEDLEESIPYSLSWARSISCDAWPQLSTKIRTNICENSNVQS